jgi:predicted nucleic acid-binding protein
MDVVLDTSAAVAVVLNERSKGALVARTEEAELIAPTSLPIEIGNAFSAMFKRGRLSLEQALRAFAHYRRIPVQLVDIDMDASLGLADALGIYAYDAYMLDCAQRHRAVLLTLDAGLRLAASRADVRVLEVIE